MITEQGLLNVAADLRLSKDGITLAPGISDNSVVKFVDNVLKDYGKTLNDLDYVVDTVIPTVEAAISEIEVRMTPTQVATLFTPETVIDPTITKVLRDVIEDSGKKEVFDDFFDGDYGFVDFTRYIGSFVTIPTIREIDNIAALDPCALIEDPFMLEDMRAQQEALKDSNKKNLEQFLGVLLNNGEMPADVNFNIKHPSVYYGMRNTLLDGVFDTFDVSFNLEMASVPTIYCTPAGQRDAQEQLSDLQEKLGFNASPDGETFMPAVEMNMDSTKRDYFETLSKYGEHFSARSKTVSLFREIREELRLDSNYRHLVGATGQTALRFSEVDFEGDNIVVEMKSIDASEASLGLTLYNSLYTEFRDTAENSLEQESDQFKYSTKDFEKELHESYELARLEIYANTKKFDIKSVEEFRGEVAAALTVGDERDTFNSKSVFPLNLASEGLPRGHDKRPWAFSIMLKIQLRGLLPTQMTNMNTFLINFY